MKHYSPAGGIMVELWRHFWIREIGTGQQVAQLHERYTMMMIFEYDLTIELKKHLLPDIHFMKFDVKHSTLKFL